MQNPVWKRDTFMAYTLAARIIPPFFMALSISAVFHVHAAGFSMYETSARNNAMGGATVGKAFDASTVYANPANMTQLPGTQALAGVTLIQPRGRIDTPTDHTNLDPDWFPPPHAYATWQAADAWWLGMGVYSEYGLGTKYPSDWSGRYNAIETTMDTLTLNPNVAYKVTDRLSLATGFRAMYLDFSNTRAIPTPSAGVPLYGDTLGIMKLNGNSWGFGYDAAASYKITDDLGFGLVYRSRVKQNVEGDVKFDSTARVPPAPYPAPPSDNRADAEADLTLPSSATGGLNYQATKKLNLGTALTWTEWSTYDALNVDFSDDILPGVNQSHSEKDWSDVWRASVGADYALTERWSLQTSYVYDMCPVSKDHADFMLPAGDRHIVGLGCGYAWYSWSFNLSYNYLCMVNNEKTVTINGQPTRVHFENGRAHMVGLSVGKIF